MNDRYTARAQVLSSFGATPAQAEELSAYCQNYFEFPSEIAELPLADEPFVDSWRQYAREVEDQGSIAPLLRKLPQLCFPIQAGISQHHEYIAATRQGADPRTMSLASGVRLRNPEQCRLLIHGTAAGHIPVLIAGTREDFVSLVQALTKKNEPVPVPTSMGACMVAGYNNWDRIRKLRTELEASGSPDPWNAALAAVKAQKHLCQDRFIILSREPYSGVPASDLGLGREHWAELSLAIRREHECAHYFTRRVLSSMRNNLLDEMIADYCGIVAAAGHYRADWQLRFLGLESFPRYREGGRLQNYRGTPALSDGAFMVLQKMAKSSAENLEYFDRQRWGDARERKMQTAMLLALSSLTIEEIASPNALESLGAALARFSKIENIVGENARLNEVEAEAGCSQWNQANAAMETEKIRNSQPATLLVRKAL